MEDRARYLLLKLLTILGPTLFVTAGEIVRTVYLRVHFSPATVSLIAIATTLVGAVIFSWYVFRAMEHLEQERRTYKEAMLSLQERERIAREMHDGVAQNLAVLKLEAYKIREALGHVDHTEEVREDVDQLETLVSQTYLEVRQTLYDLRASHRLHEGFWPAIEHQVEAFERHTSIDVVLEKHCPPHELWNELASVQILRIIQEALANVRQHAKAHQVVIGCVDEGRLVRFTIGDDGEGFDVDRISNRTEHYGLSVMRERAEAIDGCLRVTSQPGRGTTVTLEIKARGRGGSHGKGQTHVGG